jgi:hypothetical protein
LKDSLEFLNDLIIRLDSPSVPEARSVDDPDVENIVRIIDIIRSDIDRLADVVIQSVKARLVYQLPSPFVLQLHLQDAVDEGVQQGCLATACLSDRYESVISPCWKILSFIEVCG